MVYKAGQKATQELLADWAAIMRALRERGVIRTNNNPVGDIAESVVADHFRGERGSFSQSGWDVRTQEGERIQVKALRQTATNKRTNLSPIRDSDYDSVVVVTFDEDFKVVEGLYLTRELVESLFARSDHVNGRIIRVTKKLREDPRVKRIDLSEAAGWLQPIVN